MVSSNTYGRQVVLVLTNKSGGGVIAGDVVIVDTGNNDAFTTTTSAGFTGGVAVAQETIASNAVGRVATQGYVALVNVSASVTRGDFGATHTVAKQAADVGASRGPGTFCQFLTGGATPDAVLFPVDLGGTALTNPMTTAGDMITGGASGTPTRLAGSNTSFVLTSNGATSQPTWQGFMGASAYNSTTQSVSTATETPLTLDSENYDTDAIHSTSSNTSRFTVPTGGAGKWAGFAFTVWDVNTTGVRYAWWRLNGTRIRGSLVVWTPITQGTDRQCNLPPVQLAVGDYLECAVYQDSGGTRTVGVSGDELVTVAVWRVR